MNIKTHMSADSSLLGSPLKIVDGKMAVVELLAGEEMVVDDKGLIHGGFTFGLADYAAMLAVNDPFVVLGASEVRFVAPVKLGDMMRASAEVLGEKGKRREVAVQVFVGEALVMKGVFTCFILDRHVLENQV
ncbi:MAG: MaoC/PaaZ C-terminal domain-containing protein [Candidatus Bathyarchaeota archaeon]|nr:MaoC/PaaZ C-terminal domain-containing protein [Candidatus Bathyarchaeota archaeon]